MKLGYPCINRSIGCTANSTFRLASYSEEKLIEKVTQNLECLQKTLEFNLKNELLFFRIGSPLVPFASHPICRFNWQKHFEKEFAEIGKYIEENNMRISMHPDQFIVLNSKDKKVVNRAIKELQYHCDILDLMKLNSSAKIQLHVGGVYGDKVKSIKRFVDNYKKLPECIRKRLVIENDDRSYSLKDCLKVHKLINIPVLFDVFHHECINNGESVLEGIKFASKTWKDKDSILMVDYSIQKKGGKRCSHAEHIDLKLFKDFIELTKDFDFDLMLEIKDKEKSALEAIKCIKSIRK